WTGKNDSSVTTGSYYWYDQVVFSTNDIYGDSDDIYLNQQYISSSYGLPLEPNETYTVSRNVTLPGQAIGSGYLLFKTDAYNYQTESNENDNVYTQAIDIAVPNLIITNVTAPTTATAGQSLTLSWTGKNDSSVTTGSYYWYDQVVFSTNDIYGDSDDVTVISYEYISSSYGLPLEPNETYTVSRNVTLPGQAIGSGYLLFKTDAYNYQTESNENDNVYAQAIDIAAPNLTITSATAPSTGILGGAISVSWTVLNNGTVSANADWYDSVYLSNDQTWDSGDTWITAFWEAARSPLAANTSYTDTQNISIPNYAGTGDKYLIFVTDQYSYYYYNQQGETNETDNTYAVPITLGAPDLIISGATAPSSGVVNGAINVSWTVKNQGTTDAPADWYDVIYLSPDNIPGNGNDIYIIDQPISTQTPLIADGSYTINRSINLPNVTPGNYYIFFRADAYNYQGETNENNNYSQAIPITIGSPDLIVSNATAPESGALGGTVSLSWTVQNQGTVEAPADWTDYIYWSSNDTYDGSDTFITSISAAAQTPVAVGGSYSKTENITLPNQINFVGNGYLIVRADGNNAQGETDENNNDRAIPIRIDAPDLIVSNATAPASVTVGATISVTWDVKNQGTVAANADWYDRVVISTDQIFGNSDDTYLTEVWQGSFTPLAAGATYSRTLNVTLPSTATGDRFLLFKADNYNYQGETDENNNVYSLPINISASDLQVTATNAPTSAILGETVELTWTVTNNGTGAASQDWYDRVYLSSNQTLDSNDVQVTYELIATQTPLATGASYTISKNVTLPSFTAGNQYLLFVADRDNYQGEINENNNLTAVPITLTAPDLIVSNASAPATGTVGKSIEVSWTVQNQGTSAAPTDWYDRIYLSNDAIFDANADTYITQELISTQTPLAAGASYSITRNINLPNFATGNRYLIFVADGSGGQGETNETNNTRAVAINLNAPDLVVSDITAPVESLSGQPIEINWTVKNQGAATAEGTWYDYVSLVNTATNSTQYVGIFEYSGSLAAGASLNRTQSYSVPLSLTGNYRVVVTTDFYGQLAEGTQNESNNTTTDDRPISLQLAPVPNLQVTGVTAPSTAFSSQETVVQWTVKNVGTGATNAPVWYDRVYLSLDTTYDNTDTYLGDAVNPSYLNPDDSYSNSLTVTLPRGIDGNYYFLVQTDVYNYVTEVGNEGDNWGSGGPTDVNLTPPPDLQVTAVNAPNGAFSGQPMNLSWTVTNAGTGRTLETAWYDRVLMSEDATLDAGDRFLGDFYHSGALNAGENYTGSATVNLPIGVAGSFFFFVQSDIYNQVYEHVFENNNSGYDTTATNITLTPPPDLEFESLTIPNNARSGSSLSISYRVTNFGATETPNYYWTDTFYLSSDNQLNTATDINLGSVGQYGVLYPGDGYDRTANFALPNTLTGTYYVFGVTDSGDQVFELDNVNNVTQSINQVQIVSQPADLVVTDAVIPTTGEAGKAISVQWTVKNQGTGDTIVNSWSDRLVVSNDEVLGDADDLTLASFTRTGLLAPNGTYSRTESVILPFTLEGNYQLFVVTDSANSVYEGSNEGNNASSAFPLTISRDTPDLQVTSITLPDTVTPGQPLTLNWTVANLGVGRTNSNYWYDQVYLSLDKNLSGDDINLGSVYRSGALEPSASYSATGTFSLPVNLNGSYYVLVQTDRDNNVIEGAFENNNVLASDSTSGGGSGTGTLPITPAPSADLAVTAVDAPEQGIAGQSLSLTWTVVNNDANTGQNWYDAVYLSRDQVFDRNSDIYLGYRNHTGGLNAGDSYTATQSFNIPRGLGGRFYAFVVTDGGNAVYERLGEINNVNYDGFSTEIILPPPVDLAVGTITIPVNGTPGQNATISYTVNNQSTNEAIGTWEDTIYLSRDNQWDVNDAFFGRVSQTGPVAGGGSYSKTVTATLPGVATGDYYVIVRSDIRNYIPESNEANNIKASLDDFAVDVESLELGTPDTGTLGQGQSVYYRVDVSGGETLRLKLDSHVTSADNQVFVSYNAMPTRSQFEFTNTEPFVADSEVIIPTTTEGTYYVLVNSVNSPNLQDYSIQADIIPFGVQEIDVTQGGQGGNVTVKLNGAKFLPTAKVFLEDGDTKYEAQRVYYQDGVTLYATFNLENVPLGQYDVLVEAEEISLEGSATDYVTLPNAPADILFPVDPEFTQSTNHLTSRLANAFEVTTSHNVPLSLNSFLPIALRPNQAFTYTYNYFNSSNNDVASPLLLLSSDPGILTALVGDTQATSGAKLVMALADSGPSTILRPGQGGSITLTGYAPNFNTTLNLGADLVENTNYTFNLADILQSVGVDPNSDTWSQSVATLSQDIDGTWNSYEDLLRQEALEQWQEGVRQFNSNQLLLGELADLGTNQSTTSSLASESFLSPYVLGVCLDPIANDYRNKLTELAGIWAVLGWSDASDFLLRYLYGPGRDQKLGPTTRISQEAATDQDVINLNNQVTSQIQQWLEGKIKENSRPNSSNLADTSAAGLISSKSGNLKLDQTDNLKFAVNGTQGLSGEVANLKYSETTDKCNPNTKVVSYTGKLRYTFQDRYNFTLAEDVIGKLSSGNAKTIAIGLISIMPYYLESVTPDTDCRSLPYKNFITVEFPIQGTVKLESGNSQNNCPPPPPPNPKPIPVVRPIDPNDIVGPAGFGDENWITSQTLPYTIRFENQASATAPAQTVYITHPLDSDVDFRTFRLGSFGWGGLTFTVPENRSFYNQRVDLTEEHGFLVDVFAGIDIQKGEAFWTLTTIDPETGETPENPLIGFLPPNNEDGVGDGFVTYSIRPSRTAETGDVIDAEATIIFDTEEPISTPPIFNTLDVDKPSSQVDALPTTTDNPEFTVKWTGTDTGSALATYTIYVSDNGGNYTVWLNNTELTEATYTGTAGHTYSFYSVAVDNTGNTEAAPTTADATIQIGGAVNQPPQISVNAGLTLDEGANSAISNSLLAVTDPDNTADQLTFTISTIPTNGNLQRNGVTLAVNNTFTQADINSGLLSYIHNGGETTSDSFSFTVADGVGGNINVTSFVITVNPVDDAPTVLNPITDVNVNEDAANTVLDLTNIFTDIDNDPTSIVKSVFVNDNTGLVTATIVDNQLTLDYQNNQSGTANITIQGTSNGKTVDNTFLVTVNPVDDAPTVLNPITDVNVNEDAANTVLDLTNIFSDVDNDPTSIVKSVFVNDNTGLVTATIVDNQLTLDYQDNQSGIANITIRGTSNGKTVDNTFLVTVNPVDDAPTVLNPITDVNVNEDAANTVIDLTNIFSDVDNDPTSIVKSVFVNDNTGLVTATIIDNQLTLDYQDNQSGIANITIRGTSNGKTVDNSFTITVNPVDDAPTVLNPITDVNVNEDAANTVIDLTNIFSDVDNDPTSIVKSVFVNDNTGLVTATIIDNQLTLDYQNNQSGIANITIRGTSNGKTVDNSFTITVNPVNDAPTLQQEIANQTATENQPFSFTIPANTFTDIDGDNLTYNLAIVTVLPSGITFDSATRTFSGTPSDTASGTYNLIVIASDPAGEKANDSFSLNVLNAINGSSSSETVNGTSGDDHINAGAGNDSVNGGEGNDILDGGIGNDRLAGGPGDDTYIVDSSRDVAIENAGQGQDTIKSSVNYTLTVNIENITLTGNANIDGTGNNLDNLITGNSGNNLLKGLDGNDTLIGSAGNDTLIGGKGNDILTGGDGSDSFLFGSGAIFNTSDFGVDSISDFTKGSDKIILSKTSFNALISTIGNSLQAAEFATINDAANELALVGSSNAKIVYNLATGNLFYNQNGATAGLGNGGLFATLNGIPNLEENDSLIQS
ncbi:CARDB domain-containing protein, partial [Microcystis aeruginosa]|uniref:CARDB domain-containing protein n=1 Tax=Microcystis aeruginosa TaxID=1126 RepID=UPI00156288FF